MNQKKSIILISIIVLVIMCLLLIISLIVNLKNENEYNNPLPISEEKNEEDKNNDLKINFSGPEIEYNESSKLAKLMNKFEDINSVIGEDYINFNKKNEVYFISLKELNEKYSFDYSDFIDEKGNECNIDESGIFYDSEFKLFKRDEMDMGIEVYVLIDCFEN